MSWASFRERQALIARDKKSTDNMPSSKSSGTDHIDLIVQAIDAKVEGYVFLGREAWKEGDVICDSDEDSDEEWITLKNPEMFKGLYSAKNCPYETSTAKIAGPMKPATGNDGINRNTTNMNTNARRVRPQCSFSIGTGITSDTDITSGMGITSTTRITSATSFAANMNTHAHLQPQHPSNSGKAITTDESNIIVNPLRRTTNAPTAYLNSLAEPTASQIAMAEHRQHMMRRQRTGVPLARYAGDR